MEVRRHHFWPPQVRLGGSVVAATDVIDLLLQTGSLILMS